MSLHLDYLSEFRKHFQGDVRDDLASRILYSTDASIYQMEPKGVFIPKSQEDLHVAVEIAAKYKIPILARGAGTSLAGQAIGDALILDCSRWLDHIVEISPDEGYAVVEPGVVLSNLNRAASRYGLQYGPDPASADRATMGGVIGNNATGAHSILYGMSADHLLSADVILADGSLETWDESGKSKLSKTALEIREKYSEAITENFPKTWRNSAGYRLNYLLPWSPSKPSGWQTDYPPVSAQRINLAPLLAGSEGTLAVIRRAKVGLVPKPKHTILAALAYQSIADACDDVPRLLARHPSAVELIPRFIVQQARTVPAYARQMSWVVGDPAALLVVEFSSDQATALQAAVLRPRSGRAPGVQDILTVAEAGEDQARIWNVRKVGLGLLDSRPGSARPVAFIEDCAIPVQSLGEFVREVERVLAAHGTEGGIYAHASAGCLHIRPILDLKTSRGVTDLRAIAEAVLSLTLQLGGAMSSEHGDGLARSEFLERTYGPELMEAMGTLKRAADPEEILNPGKIIDAPKMDANLRYGTVYQTRVWESNLSFRRQGSLALAIEQCNGQGLCRKSDGVMCPSYQATREEMHSTRGRANLLRALISSPELLRGATLTGEAVSKASDETIPSDNGRLLATGTLRSRRGAQGATPRNDTLESVAQALDLCLACKGCKAECPSGVDMAKLKFAFQAEYYKTHRRQLRDYLFGYFHVAAGLASSLAPLSNWILEIPVLRKLFANALGITPHRPFPKFSNELARVRRIPLASGVANPSARKIILLSDPFARYIEPESEQAAFDILSACGFDIHVLSILGAGASLLSKGFIEGARYHTMRVLSALAEVEPACQVPIVGIEPPEIYTLKHDYVDLLPEREEEIDGLVSRVWLLDEFLLRSSEFDALRVARLDQSFDPHKVSSRKIRFHPHCHQRAEGPAPDGLPTGTSATMELLRRCGYAVDLLDTGCCGMAGTFGYEAEHYELSMKVGQLKLFRELAPSHPPPNTQGQIQLSRENSKADLGEVSRSDGGGRIVSTGAACRLQIRQGAGIDAQHSIVMVAQALFGSQFS